MFDLHFQVSLSLRDVRAGAQAETREGHRLPAPSLQTHPPRDRAAHMSRALPYPSAVKKKPQRNAHRTSR